jgi:hypothetical protein
MFKGKVLLFSLLLVFATSAFAGDVNECLSDCGISCDAMRINCCPAADFDYVWESCHDGTDDDYIWVDVLDSSGNGIPGIPWTDYWIGACTPSPGAPNFWDLCVCPDGVIADSLTNAAGRTTISGRLGVGGCILSGGIYLQVQGKTIMIYAGSPTVCPDPICMNIQIVSPDLTHDCWVITGDLGKFGDTYYVDSGLPDYDDCADYSGDGECTLSDFAFLGEHWTHECQ